MCRFVAYLGDSEVTMQKLLAEPCNSLVRQSRCAREGGAHGVNADGFGAAWYTSTTQEEPGVFKTTQPAWNDRNLRHIARSIQAKCFLAHIRASTVGDVTENNCHPFAHKQYSLVHNGTITEFESLRRTLLNQLKEPLFLEIKGQTDSECLFFLIMQFLESYPKESLEKAVERAFSWIVTQQSNKDAEHFCRLNIVITDGKSLVATRFVSKGHEPLSLYYSPNHSLAEVEQKHVNSVIIASEALDDCVECWQSVPANHYLVVDSNLQIQVRPLLI